MHSSRKHLASVWIVRYSVDLTTHLGLSIDCLFLSTYTSLISPIYVFFYAGCTTPADGGVFMPRHCLSATIALVWNRNGPARLPTGLPVWLSFPYCRSGLDLYLNYMFIASDFLHRLFPVSFAFWVDPFLHAFTCRKPRQLFNLCCFWIVPFQKIYHVQLSLRSHNFPQQRCLVFI